MRVQNNPPAVDTRRRASNTAAADAAEKPARKSGQSAARAPSAEGAQAASRAESPKPEAASIKDMGEARETAAQAKSSILSEISVARLVQANVTPQTALMLLQ